MIFALSLSQISEGPAGRSVQDKDKVVEKDSFAVRLTAGAVWAFTRGTASAKNSFIRFERGEDLDLRDDFNLDRGAALLDASVGVRFADRHHLSLRELFGSVSARVVLDRTFEYNDGVFLQGEHAHTKLEIDFRDLEYACRFLDGQPVTLWAGAGGRWSHLNVGIRSSTLDPAGSMEENTALYPTLNARVDYALAPSWTVSLEVRGSPAALPILFHHPSLGRFVEVRPSVEWTISPSVTMEAGGMFLWLWQRWRGRESDGHHAVNYVDLQLYGPTLSIAVSF